LQKGETPLHYAAQLSKAKVKGTEDIDIVNVLLEHGADCTAVTHQVCVTIFMSCSVNQVYSFARTAKPSINQFALIFNVKITIKLMFTIIYEITIIIFRYSPWKHQSTSAHAQEITTS